jgi:ribonuclease P/MRP protein subunit POP1
MKEIQTTAALPRGMVLGLKVHDPRLRYAFVFLLPISFRPEIEYHSFPPTHRPPVSKGGPASRQTAPSLIFTPSGALASSELWDQDARDKIRHKKFTKSELDRRRSKVLT